MEDLFADGDDPPVLVADEPDEPKPDEWLIHAYFDHQPTATRSRSSAGSAAATAAGRATRRERLGDDEPGRAAADPRRPLLRPHADLSADPPSAINFEIDAGLAFGTGQHATTSRLPRSARPARARRRALRQHRRHRHRHRAARVRRAWPCGREAKCIATDIDPVAVDVARDNAAINGVTLGHGAGELLLAVADGMDSPMLAARAPFDLIIANILAGPLIELAPDFARALAPGGSVILAGLLDTQADGVARRLRGAGPQASSIAALANGRCWCSGRIG